MKKFILRALFGLGMGALLQVIVTNGIYLFGDGEYLNGNIFLNNSIGTLILGILFSIATLYFHLIKLKLYQQTILHIITISIPYIIIARWLNWMPNDVGVLIGCILFFIVLYGVIWLSIYFYFRNVANHLNEDLKNL